MENQWRAEDQQGRGYPAMLNNGGGGMVGMNDFHAFRIPPGYRFCPTDGELIEDYLKRKLLGLELSYQIPEVDIYAYNPKQLFDKYNKEEEQEWYFFTPRNKKYPNGKRPDRSAKDGSWKPTGDYAPVRHKETGIQLGFKRALKFQWRKKGDGPAHWLMHEYTILDGKSTSKNSARAAKKPLRKAPDNMKLDEWVLVRIYRKRGASKDNSDETDDVEALILPSPSFPSLQEAAPLQEAEDLKQETYCSPMTQPILFPTYAPNQGFGQEFYNNMSFHGNQIQGFDFPLSFIPENQHLLPLPPPPLPPLPPLPLPPLPLHEQVLSELCGDFSYLFDESLTTNHQDFLGGQFFPKVENGLNLENHKFDGDYYANAQLPNNNNSNHFGGC